MSQIRDMLYVKSIEKRLRRPLTDEEMDGEECRVFFPDGHIEFIEVPHLEFPYDLLTKPEDYYQSEMNDLSKVA
jgi:hypothetical protein